MLFKLYILTMTFLFLLDDICMVLVKWPHMTSVELVWSYSLRAVHDWLVQCSLLSRIAVGVTLTLMFTVSSTLHAFQTMIVSLHWTPLELTHARSYHSCSIAPTVSTHLIAPTWEYMKYSTRKRASTGKVVFPPTFISCEMVKRWVVPKKSTMRTRRI